MPQGGARLRRVANNPREGEPLSMSSMAVPRSLDNTWGNNITIEITERLILTTYMTIRDTFRVTRDRHVGGQTRVRKAPMRLSNS
eukprot:3603455-Prymnesium_polylepis.1